MSYRFKIIFSFLAISIISTMIAIVMFFCETRVWVMKDVRDKATAIAGSVAAGLNGDLVGQLRTMDDEKKPSYAQIKEILQKARDATSGSSMPVRFIYTLYPDPNHHHNFLFGVCPDQGGKHFSHLGMEDPGATRNLLYDHLLEAYSSGKFVRDAWGIWLTGYAPIFDSKGNYVASVGVDIGIDWAKGAYRHLFYFSVLTFLISTLAAIILGIINSSYVTSSLKKLEEATDQIGKGDFSYRIELKTKDEFAAIAHSLNKMNEGLKEKERVKWGFAQFISQHVLDFVIKTKGASFVNKEKQKVTFFYSDLLNLSRLEETMSVEQLVACLNEYFKEMIEILYKHNGMVFKLISDGLLAEFILSSSTQEWDAVQAAIEMQKAIKVLQEKWGSKIEPPLEISIAIHTREADTSGIASPSIDDSVKMTGYLQTLANQMHYPILISRSTYMAVKDKVLIRSLGPQYVTGSETLIDTYEVILHYPARQIGANNS